MTNEQKDFVRCFDFRYLKPAQSEGNRHLERGNACGKEALYRFLNTIQYTPIGDGGFQLEFMLKRKKFTAVYAVGRSTVEIEAYLEILKNVLESAYYGYGSSTLRVRPGAIPNFYRAVLELQKIVVPDYHTA